MNNEYLQRVVEWREESKHDGTWGSTNVSGMYPFEVIENLILQLQQARREGWEQAKAEAVAAICEECPLPTIYDPVPDECTICTSRKAIANMGYEGKYEQL